MFEMASIYENNRILDIRKAFMPFYQIKNAVTNTHG